MPKIQRGPDGRHAVTIPADIVTLKQWEKGGIIDFAEVDGLFVLAQKGDLLVRYRPPPPKPKP